MNPVELISSYWAGVALLIAALAVRHAWKVACR